MGAFFERFPIRGRFRTPEGEAETKGQMAGFLSLVNPSHPRLPRPLPQSEPPFVTKTLRSVPLLELFVPKPAPLGTLAENPLDWRVSLLFVMQSLSI